MFEGEEDPSWSLGFPVLAGIQTVPYHHNQTRCSQNFGRNISIVTGELAGEVQE